MRIDLHGLTEQEATGVILSALFSMEFDPVDEIEFVTGQGDVLRGVLFDILDEENYRYYQSKNNPGSYIVPNPFLEYN